MTYQNARKLILTGDVVGVKGTGLFSKVVMFMTKEKFSHVAMFVWHGTGLWVYEFVEGRGYQCTPASQWFEIREGQATYIGKAPNSVRAKPEKVLESASSFRFHGFKQHYGILSLAKVWFAQIIKKDIPTRFKVCSTFIQFVWEYAGHDFTVTPDPGDIMREAENNGPVIPVT